MQALSRGLPKLISLALGFKRSLACSFIFTTMVGALLLSCRNQVADEIDSIAFNPTIRRDLHALTQAQRQGNLSPFYNNGHLGDGEISELYPIPPDLGSEDSVLQEVLSKLKRSDYYYAAAGERLKLAWELVIHGINVAGDNGCLKPDVGACTDSDPIDRDCMRLIPTWVSLPGISASMQVQACRGPGPSDPNDERQVFDSDCVVVATSCPDVNQSNPIFCELDCGIEARTGTYRVIVNGFNMSPQHVFKPTIFVTNTVRRPLEVDVPETEADPDYIHLVWKVAESSNQTWQENYSPALYITRVRVKSADLAEGYIQPSELDLYWDNTRIGSRCDPDPGLQEFSARTCVQLRAANPAYHSEDKTRIVTWKLKVPRTVAGSFNASPNSRLYVEFTLGTLGNRTPNGLAIDDPTELFALASDQDNRRVDAFKVMNQGATELRIVGTQVTSHDGEQLTLEWPGNRQLPFIMYPHDEIPVTVIAHPTGKNGVNSEARITAQDNQGTMLVVVGRIFAKPPLVAQFNILPESRQQFHTSPPEEQQRRFVIANNGNDSLIIRSIDITGRGHFAFSLVNVPGRPFTVEPGQVQILTVRYNPDDNPFTNGGTAHDNAVLMVSSSVGDKTVELEGSGLVNLRRRFEIRLNPNTNRLR